MPRHDVRDDPADGLEPEDGAAELADPLQTPDAAPDEVDQAARRKVAVIMGGLCAATVAAAMAFSALRS